MTRPRLVGQALAPDLAADSALSGRAKLTAVLAVDDFYFGALYAELTRDGSGASEPAARLGGCVGPPPPRTASGDAVDTSRTLPCPA